MSNTCRENFVSDLIKGKNTEECLKAFTGLHTSCAGQECKKCAFRLDSPYSNGRVLCMFANIKSNLRDLRDADMEKLRKSRDNARIFDNEWSNFCSNFSCCDDCPLDSAQCFEMRNKINQYHKNITLNLKEENEND